MSIDYKKVSRPHRLGGSTLDRYDAKVGPFFVGAQDNGEGWWNWWIALSAQDPAAGVHAIYDRRGGALSWDGARRTIEQILREVADNILEALT